MAEYPSTVATYREIENRKDVVFDSGNKTTFFAEDLRKLQDEQQAVQQTVGAAPPAGTTPVVDALASALDRISDLEALWSSLYRIGSLYFNTSDDTNPATILGFGTWEPFGHGRMLLATGPNSATWPIGEEGGTYGHDISHKHETASGFDNNHFYGHGDSNGRPIFGSTVTTAPTRHRTNLATATDQGVRTARTDTGGDTSLDNLPPYITVYVWERTA